MSSLSWEGTIMNQPETLLKPHDGLLIVDVQNDFFPGWKLPVEGAEAIIPVLNRWIAAAQTQLIPIYCSRDWHPVRHTSFHDGGGPWPVHCLQDSPGARFHPDLNLPDSVVKITKGVRFDQDQNSVFDETGLADQLKRDRVTHLWVGGLALDVCVLASVLDARQAGFDVSLIRQATRPVDVQEGEAALGKMREAGVSIFEE